MNTLGNDLFSGAGLSDQKDVAVLGSDFLSQGDGGGQLGSMADDAVEGIAGGFSRFPGFSPFLQAFLQFFEIFVLSAGALQTLFQDRGAHDL